VSTGAGLRAVALASRLATAAAPAAEPLPAATRAAALKQVETALAKEGLIDAATGKVTDETKKKFSFEITTSLPTPGLLVRGCLDDCDVCEPTLEREIELDLERKALENKLLQKQIDLLEKSQEYRCCPADEEEEGGDGD
jgi:hypothetical protein